ncbi:hypothetical protein [Pseudanabaena sp. PCC 6802]|uniref:hypothetical protein n=1 Tax=Pseudanabaena sp. PCC 6802 TaxID=118173 RepID=UPI00034950DA|nr:hypothetical protein [Pseudanabaena sp. PCC 6802]
MQTISAANLDITDLIQSFSLERCFDREFFSEWQEDLPELSETEQQVLDEVRADYENLSAYGLLEPLVKMVVLSPLLKLAGFYRLPFRVVAEQEMEIRSDEDGIQITGKIDILVFVPELWVTVIEAKRTSYSVIRGIPQLLAYSGFHLRTGFIFGVKGWNPFLGATPPNPLLFLI